MTERLQLHLHLILSTGHDSGEPGQPGPVFAEFPSGRVEKYESHNHTNSCKTETTLEVI